MYSSGLAAALNDFGYSKRIVSFFITSIKNKMDSPYSLG
jgi:hypothetical protein